MLHVHYLDDLDLPELEPYRTLRRRKDMDRLNLLVAEGEKCVRRLLDSRFDYELVSILCTAEWLMELRPELEVRPEDIQIYVTDEESIGKISGYAVYQAIKVTARIVKEHVLEEIIEETTSPRLLVACDGLTNAENMGAIIRNTAAFGGNAVLVGEETSSPYLTRTIRASMGTVFEVPCVYSDRLANTLKNLKVQGMRIIGAHAHTDQKTIANVGLDQDVVIVFGSEGFGISKDVERVCDDLVMIPMAGTVDSLNVGSSVSVFLYEAARQRGRM